jgi:hypothetical protein
MIEADQIPLDPLIESCDEIRHAYDVEEKSAGDDDLFQMLVDLGDQAEAIKRLAVDEQRRRQLRKVVGPSNMDLRLQVEELQRQRKGLMDVVAIVLRTMNYNNIKLPVPIGMDKPADELLREAWVELRTPELENLLERMKP